MYARFHRPGPGKWRIVGLCPDAGEIWRGRRLRWSAVLAVCWTFLSVSVGGVHAGRLNDPLVPGGVVESFLVSPDNQRVVYRADQSRDQTFELHSLPIAGGAVTTLNGPLVPGGDVFDFLISPDSGRVVYQADQDADDRVELYSVPLAGGAATKLNGLLVPAGHVLSGFLISADSGQVVYRAAQDTADTSELYSVPLAGGAATKLSGLLPADSDVLPGFLISADSGRAVYRAAQDTAGVIELYSVPLSGGVATKLNDPLVPSGDVESFLISPDSQRVVYIADQDEDQVFEVYSVPLAGGTVTKLNSPLVPGGDEEAVRISPDSQRVVYVADQDGDEVFELYSVPLGGGAVTKLNGSLAADGDVSFVFLISPDSQQVVYRADQDMAGVFELYSVPLGGGTVTKLNDLLVASGDVKSFLIGPDGQQLESFLISPDSQQVVYVADQDADEVDELYSVPLGGGTVTKLNDLLVASGDVFAFRIGPDSQRVVYVADQDTTGVDELYSAPLSGGVVTKLNGPLVTGGDVITNFFVSPNSGPVLYRADQDTNNVLELYTDILQAELKALFESPLANAVAAGIALIRGWAFDTVAGEVIASVQLFIDGVLDADATCCSERSDVRAAFPAFPAANTLDSGWGLTKNWGNLSSGSHTVRVEMTSTSGEVFRESRTVTVVKPGDFGFLDQFTLSGAAAGIVGQQLQLASVQIRDSASQATATVDVAYIWQPPSQQFELQTSTVLAQTTPQRMWAFQTRRQALQTLFTPASVSAQGLGLRTTWEGPVAGPVGGVDLVRGWGYEQAPAAELAMIRFFIDNVQNAVVVCCSPRPDVAAAFPADANALLSGWGLTLNWGNLSSGPHTVRIEITSTSGEVLSESRTVTVVKLGGFGFLSGVSLTGATVSLDGEEIILSGVTVTEAGTANTAQVTLRLRWDIGAQALRLVSTTAS